MRASSFQSLLKALSLLDGVRQPVYIRNTFQVTRGMHYMYRSYGEMNEGDLCRMRGWDQTEKVL